MPPVPASSIDYDRRFSLPLGVPPDLGQQQLGAYLGGLGLSAQFLYYDAAALFDSDPRGPRDRRVRVLDGAEMLLPRSTNLPGPLSTTATVVAQDRIDAVAKETWVAAQPDPNRSLVEVEASTFRWDAESRKVSALPLPAVTDESLVLHWGDVAAGGGLLETSIPGILADDASPHLLATGTTSRDGELDRLILRSPVVGLVRFERYRHLRRAGAGLSVSHPSVAGRLVVRGLPVRLTPPEAGSPLFGDRVIVFENVELASASDCVASLAVLQFLRAPLLLASQRLRPHARTQLSWLLRSWIAYLRVVRPTVRPADPDPYPSLPPALRAPFETANHASRVQVTNLLAQVFEDATARASLDGFVSSFYAPLLCGRSWHELGVELPADPATRPAELSRAHATLENLPRASDAWLAAYAGCPLGKPARVYVPAGTPLPADPLTLARTGLTTFELEAVVIGGKAGDLYGDVAAPALPPELDQLDLSAFDGKSPGALAFLRSLDESRRQQEYTTYDWLSEVVKGAHRRTPTEDPPLDFEQFADGGRPAAQRHPLASPLEWQTRKTALTLGAGLQALAAARIGAQRLDAAILQWWKDRTGITVAGNWPTLLPFEGELEVPAGPRDPYRDEATRPGVSGFDAFDLENALLAEHVVLGAKNPLASIELGLVFALMDREGYRAGAAQDRSGVLRAEGWRGAHTPRVPDLAPPGHRAPQRADLDVAVLARGRSWLDAAGFYDWIHFPYGLDVFMQQLVVGGVRRPVRPFEASLVDDAPASFRQRIDDLKSAGTLLTDPDPAYLSRFGSRRIEGRFSVAGPAGILQNRRRSRRLQWLGIVCQQAEFQKRHGDLSRADGALFRVVPELVDPALPPVGADANSAERRRFIAYYALVYLAFNVLPSTWNQWVRSADENRPVGEPASTFLLYYRNVMPRAVEPPLAGPIDNRRLAHRATMLRFAVALDAYLRLDPSGAVDTSDPAARAW